MTTPLPRLHRALHALKIRLARRIGKGTPPLTFTQSCVRCRTFHPSNYRNLMG